MDEAERKFLAEFIRESDAIENIKDDMGLLERQIAEDKTDGHVGAMLWLELLARTGRGGSLVDEKLICQIQGFITAEQYLRPGGPELRREWIGKYRNVNVSVGGRECPDHRSIPALMDFLLEQVRGWQRSVMNNASRHDICTVADFHFVFEKIHPFADGNGRTGRALVWYLLKCAGVEPFIFTNRDKHETYYLCFEKPVDMRRYFMSKMGLGIQTVTAQ